MYASVQINNFRCFEDLSIGKLEKVNLFSGKNNVGKTVLLEALWLLHGYQNPELGVRIDSFRGIGFFAAEELMTSLFSNFDQNKEIVISSKDTDSQEMRLSIKHFVPSSKVISIKANKESKKYRQKIGSIEEASGESSVESRKQIQFSYKYSTHPPIESKAFIEDGELKFEFATKLEGMESLGIYLASGIREPLSVLAERYGNLEVKKDDVRIIKALQIIEPNLNRISVRHIVSSPMIYADIGMDKMIPIQLMGDGIGRLLRILLAIANAGDGIVLIDEIENGFYHKTLKNVWGIIDSFAQEYNVQVFATTHSRECIDSAHQAFSEKREYCLLMHRLESVKGKIKAITYDKEALEAAIRADFEVR